MGQYVAPIRDMQFLLHEMFNVTEELKAIPKFEDVDADIINQVLEEGAKFTQEVLFPLNHSGDREGCHYDAATKSVTTPKGFKDAYQKVRRRRLGRAGLRSRIRRPGLAGGAE